MTLSHQQLFVINDCFETQPQTHILCCRRESVRSLNLIDEFSLLKSENKSILFFVHNSLFHKSLTTLVTQSKFHVDDKKLLMRKICQLQFASYVNSLTLSHNCQEKFSSQWGLLNNWWNGARRLSTVEKEEALTFQAADLATTVPLTYLQNYIASKTNHCFKSFGKNISFLLYWIHKVKM